MPPARTLVSVIMATDTMPRLPPPVRKEAILPPLAFCLDDCHFTKKPNATTTSM